MLEKLIKKFEIRCVAKNLVGSTIKNYKTTLLRLDAFLTARGIESIEDIDDDVIGLYLSERNKVVKKVTVKCDFVTIRTFFNYLVKAKVIQESPMESMEKPKVPKRVMRSFNAKEVNQLLNYFDKSTFFGLRNHTIMLTLFGTGMRISELCNLQFEDINLDADTINVIGKGDKQRYIPLNDVLKGALAKYAKRRQAYMQDRCLGRSSYLFVSRTGKKLNKANIEDVFIQVKKDLGIVGERFCAHTWRHTFAVNYLRNGGDVFTLQKILGHEKLETTKIYIDMCDNDMHVQNARFNPLMNSKWQFFNS